MENPSQTPITSAQENTVSRSNKKPSLLMLLSGVVLVTALVAGGIGYYLGSMQLTKSITKNTQSEPVIQVPSTPQATQIESQPTIIYNEYRTRYFDVLSNFYGDEPYPTSLTQGDDSTLVPMVCTPTYSGYGDFNKFTTYDEQTQKSTTISDPNLLKYLSILDAQNEDKQQNEIREIFACTSKNNETIIAYSLGPCGGGCTGIPKIGILDGETIKEAPNSSILNEAMAYFGCRKPLQLTNQGEFYFECGGGDGSGGSASIYRLSIKDLGLKLVSHCESGVDENGNPTLSCK